MVMMVAMVVMLDDECDDVDNVTTGLHIPCALLSLILLELSSRPSIVVSSFVMSMTSTSVLHPKRETPGPDPQAQNPTAETSWT